MAGGGTPCGQTNMSKNITFPQLRLGPVKIPHIMLIKKCMAGKETPGFEN